MSFDVQIVTDLNEKIDTRSLYEEVFTNETIDCTDYYYSEVIKRNKMIIAYDKGDIIGMMHLNPYLYEIMGTVRKVYYIVAVCVKPEYRHKGVLTEMFNTSFAYMKKERIPFCFLLPKNDNIQEMYKKFGFEVVAKFTLDKFITNDDGRYSVFPVRDEEFETLMNEEMKYLDFEDVEYIEDLRHKKVCAKVIDGSIEIQMLRKQNCYFCQEM